MTATLNSINSVMQEIARLHDILAEDVASLHGRKDAPSTEAIAAKQRAAEQLEATKRELDGLKSSTHKWTRDVLKLE